MFIFILGERTAASGGRAGREREREREREKIPRRFRTVSVEPDAGLEPHELQDHDLS